ncbi:MAG: hypothetical protein ACYCXA_15070 [Actinomycetes bacterium]
MPEAGVARSVLPPAAGGALRWVLVVLLASYVAVSAVANLAAETTLLSAGQLLASSSGGAGQFTAVYVSPAVAAAVAAASRAERSAGWQVENSWAAPGAGAQVAVGLIGLTALGLAAVSVVGAAWSEGVVSARVAQQGRRLRIPAAQLLTLWLVGLGIVALAAVTAVAVAPFLRHTSPLGVPDPSGIHAWTTSLGLIGRAVVALACGAGSRSAWRRCCAPRAGCSSRGPWCSASASGCPCSPAAALPRCCRTGRGG